MKVLKNNIIGFVLIAAMLMATLSACGGSGGGSTSGGGDTGSGGSGSSGAGTAAVEDDTVYTLAVNFSTNEASSQSYAKTLAEITEKSGGRLQFDIYWSNGLVASNDEIPRGYIENRIDMSGVALSGFPAEMPLDRILSLPFMGLQDMKGATDIRNQLVDEFPEMLEEYTNLNMLHLGTFSFCAYNIKLNTKTPEVHYLEDLAGLSLNVSKLEVISVLESYGAMGVRMPPPMIYPEIEKNVMQGYINSDNMSVMFGLTDLAQQHVNFGANSLEQGMWFDFQSHVINKTFFESLPQDLQGIIVDTFAANAYDWVDEFNAMGQKGVDIAEEKGDLIVTLTDAEIAVWKEAFLPTHAEAIEEINKIRGDDAAQRIYDRSLVLIAEYYN